MANSLFISEVLCFVANKFSKLTRVQLKSTLVGFYNDDELNDAKDVLFDDAGKLDIDDVPRNVRRTKGDNRAKLIADDILDLYSFLDEKRQRAYLPTYAAQNLDRIPSVKLEDMELFCIAKKMESMEKRLQAVELVDVANLTAKFDGISQRIENQQASVNKAVDVLVSKLDTVALEPLASGASTAKLCTTVDKDEGMRKHPVRESEPTTAATDFGGPPVLQKDVNCSAVIDGNDPTPKVSDGWHTVGRTQGKPKPAVRVRGSKVHIADDDVVKAVPRKSVLAAFVSRLHRDTTEEELTKYLLSEGMKGVVCRRLKHKDGMTFRTAAFYVSCCTDSADYFYNEECWPAGAELRDWIYKN